MSAETIQLDRYAILRKFQNTVNQLKAEIVSSKEEFDKQNIRIQQLEAENQNFKLQLDKSLERNAELNKQISELQQHDRFELDLKQSYHSQLYQTQLFHKQLIKLQKDLDDERKHKGRKRFASFLHKESHGELGKSTGGSLLMGSQSLSHRESGSESKDIVIKVGSNSTTDLVNEKIEPGPPKPLSPKNNNETLKSNAILKSAHFNMNPKLEDLEDENEEDSDLAEQQKIFFAEMQQRQQIYEQEMQKRDQEIKMMKKYIRLKELEVDEVKIMNFKAKRKIEELESKIDKISVENERLTQRFEEVALENQSIHEDLKILAEEMQNMRDEGDALRLRIQQNQETMDRLRRESEILIKNNETLSKQNKMLTADTNRLQMERDQLIDANQLLAEKLDRYEKEYKELFVKMEKLTMDYEHMVKMKDDRILLLEQKLQEEMKRHEQANIDADLLVSYQEKWQMKEQDFLLEVDSLRATIQQKETLILELKLRLSEASHQLFEPRMQKLASLEKEMRKRIEAFSVMEETMETGFLCQRCAKFMHIPMTILPCSHTYCPDCIQDMKEENFNHEQCQECPEEPVDLIIHNEQLQTVSEHFWGRKEMVKSFLDWAKTVGSI